MSSPLFSEAQRFIAGGVNSPVRAFNGVGGAPVFIASAEGPCLIAQDGRRFIDYVGSWGPMIAGHAHPRVIEAVRETAAGGLSFGAPTVLETELARRVCGLMPSIERVRFVNSGTEATMSAIRLARAATGRDKVLKFEGCYHGHADGLLVKAGSGALTLGAPSSPGVPASYTQHTLVARFNDLDSVRAAFKKYSGEIACVIVEPVAGNMNCIPPLDGFLQGLRDQCDAHGSLLIFDEVMTGFRVAAGGAQQRYGVSPDLTTLGKIIGGGMPVGAFGGKEALMNHLAPEGPVYQAGTLSGNPVATAAGIATLKLLCESGFYQRLEESTARLCGGLKTAAADAGIPLSVNQAGSMFGLFFTDDEPVRFYEQVTACDIKRFRAFFHSMLEQDIYLAPSAFEAGFVSAAHDEAAIDKTLAAARKAFAELGRGVNV